MYQSFFFFLQKIECSNCHLAVITFYTVRKIRHALNGNYNYLKITCDVLLVLIVNFCLPSPGFQRTRKVFQPNFNKFPGFQHFIGGSEINNVLLRENSYPVMTPAHVQQPVSFLYSVPLLYRKLVIGTSEAPLCLILGEWAISQLMFFIPWCKPGGAGHLWVCGLHVKLVLCPSLPSLEMLWTPTGRSVEGKRDEEG